MISPIQRLLQADIDWVPTELSEFIFECTVENRTVFLRLNDFPQEPLCTVITDESETDLHDFPAGWKLPRHRHPPESQNRGSDGQ